MKNDSMRVRQSAAEPHKLSLTGATPVPATNLLLIYDQNVGIDKSIWEAGEALLKSGTIKWLALSSPSGD